MSSKFFFNFQRVTLIYGQNTQTIHKTFDSFAFYQLLLAGQKAHNWREKNLDKFKWFCAAKSGQKDGAVHASLQVTIS
jgi:hypothetical protein